MFALGAARKSGTRAPGGVQISTQQKANNILSMNDRRVLRAYINLYLGVGLFLAFEYCFFFFDSA